METGPTKLPRLMALFDRKIDGDDSLLRLASLRFKQAGLGPEFYAETPAELNRLMNFKPAPESPTVVHLHRTIDLLEEASQRLILDFALRFAGRVYGLVIHDQLDIVTRFDDYVAALWQVDARLSKIEGSPYLFVEYAAGLEPERFIEIFKSSRDLERICGCIDTGHIGLWQVRVAYSRQRPGEDVFSLSPNHPKLSESIEDLEEAVCSAIIVVLDAIEAFRHFGKPLHLHLHDAHPLSDSSPFGISDHLSFLDEIPIPFERNGKRSLTPMFGPTGLKKIVVGSLQAVGPDGMSITLEIHPVEGRLRLGDASYLFDHWVDKTNAERMNHWLSVILRNQQHVLSATNQSLVTNFGSARGRSHGANRKDDRL
ncbi:MAG: hypothetical protein JSU72_11190 [Deltaproteobacteria bacterium]|nr:MAG: hypothetical protein JSU72_11190 [Deltaproteobacteria bacterium]